MKNIKFLLFLGFFVFLLGCQPEEKGALTEAIPDKIDFNLHIRPILSDRCFNCHGPDKGSRKADLRLDTKEGLFGVLANHDGLRAVVPGKPKSSALYQRVMSEDPDIQMPPPESNLQVTEREKRILKKWIDQGADWKAHWAFIPPELPSIPKVENKDWAKNEIDYFILAKLEEKGWEPQKEADKYSLLRRVSLDLTGLPPSPKEIQAFVEDESPTAYEKVVDRLLSSPHYGETRAISWLDLARYADTHGYQADYYRPHWRWRDWVIEAFNKNQPFDEFVTWQLAGDLIPNASKEQILATGFNRNHAQNAEGGIVDEEYRVEYVADRAQTVGTAFLGLTMQCARCHDHKYDPISQKEFYQLFAYFNNVPESGQITWYMKDLPGPTLLLPDAELEKQIEFIKDLKVRKEDSLAINKKALNADFENWLEKGASKVVMNGKLAHYDLEQWTTERVKNQVQGGVEGRIIDPLDGQLVKKKPEQVDRNGSKGILLAGDEALSFPGLGRFSRSQAFSIGMWVNIPDALEKGVIFHSNKGSALYTFKGYQVSVEEGFFDIRLAHDFPSNALHLVSKKEVPRSQWIHITLTYDGSSKAEGVAFYIDGQEAEMEIRRDHLYKDMVFHGQKEGDPIPVSTHLKVGARWRGKGFTKGQVDEIIVFNRQLTAVEVGEIAGKGSLSSLLNSDLAQLSSSQKQDLFDYYCANFSTKYQAHLAELQKLRQEQFIKEERVPAVMVMEEMDQARAAYVLDRGVYDQKTEEVFPGTPASIPPLNKDFERNRLGFAQWLFDEKNPLTSRVTVNRFWQHYFGAGLVKTTEDFGAQGSLPSHPQLLDYLAVSFVKSGWDVKAMQKQMVMSASYRQASSSDSILLKNDPDNIYLARSPKARLSAEMIRDLALAASDLLNKKVGGASVKPYQPEGLWDFNRMSGAYNQDHGDDLYRRSMYTFWKRTIPPPSMKIFDAPTRAYCVVRREKTATPLQALVLMNDPQFVEAARVLGQNLMLDTETSMQDKIKEIWLRLTSREPSQEQMDILLKQFEKALAKYDSNEDSRNALLEVGEYPIDAALDKNKLAAITTVVTTVMNFDATIRKW